MHPANVDVSQERYLSTSCCVTLTITWGDIGPVDSNVEPRLIDWLTFSSNHVCVSEFRRDCPAVGEHSGLSHSAAPSDASSFEPLGSWNLLAPSGGYWKFVALLMQNECHMSPDQVRSCSLPPWLVVTSVRLAFPIVTRAVLSWMICWSLQHLRGIIFGLDPCLPILPSPLLVRMDAHGSPFLRRI